MYAFAQVYHDTVTELDAHTSSATSSMKSAIFGRLALQYDQLLEDLEGEDRSHHTTTCICIHTFLYSYI